MHTFKLNLSAKSYVHSYKCSFITGVDDYESGSFSITILAGEIRASYNILIINNNIFEASESFSLSISSSSLPSKALIEPDCMLVVTIVDDNGELHTSFLVIAHTYQLLYN